jgi:maltooligosyltrehalose synthase
MSWSNGSFKRRTNVFCAGTHFARDGSAESAGISRLIDGSDNQARTIRALADAGHIGTVLGLSLSRRDEDDTNLFREGLLECLEAIGLAHPHQFRGHVKQQHHGYAVRDETSPTGATASATRAWRKGGEGNYRLMDE